MKNPDFPSWKHLLIILTILILGNGVALIPIVVLVVIRMVENPGDLDPDAVNDTAGMMELIGPEWFSHLAPFMHGLPLIAAAWYGWVQLGKPSWRLGFKGVSVGAGVLSVLGTLFIANGSTMIAEFLPGYESFARAMEQMLVPGVGMALAIVIGAPLFEEALFRGVLLRGYLRKTKPWIGIVASGLMFGVMHLLPVHVFFASIVGFALGYVYYRTRSLGLVILIHLINNGSSYALSFTDVPATWTEMTGWGMGPVIGLALITTSLGVGTLWLLGNNYAPVPVPAEDLPPAEPSATGGQFPKFGA